MRRNTQGSLFILLKKAEKILGSALRACKGGRDLKAILLTYFSPTEQCLICLTYITYKTTENKHVRKQACPNSLMWPWAACTLLWIFSWRYLLKDCRTVLLRWSILFPVLTTGGNVPGDKSQLLSASVSALKPRNSVTQPPGDWLQYSKYRPSAGNLDTGN